jgi:hypothetical protein
MLSNSSCPYANRGGETSQEAQVEESRRSESAIDRSRVAAMLLAAVVAAILIAPKPGQAAPHTPAHLYDCKPRSPKMADPPPKPDLPPHVDQILQEAIAADEFERFCPVGEVPHPTRAPATSKNGPRLVAADTARASRVRSKRQRRLASASRQASGGWWYSWAMGYQLFNGKDGVNGLWAIQTNEQPYIPVPENVGGAHSLAQLWGVRETQNGCWSTIETGWMESGSYGDVEPHLFIAAFDCGIWRGYAGKPGGLGWQQSSGVVFPNQVLTHNDVFHVYGARMDGNNMWIYYDGQWVGYVPHAAWPVLFPAIFNEIQAGGEVTTQNHNTCADMGYGGLFGTHPWAAMFSDIWYDYDNNTKASSAFMNTWASDPNQYVTGQWGAGYPGSEFRYGGPGWC